MQSWEISCVGIEFHERFSVFYDRSTLAVPRFIVCSDIFFCWYKCRNFKFNFGSFGHFETAFERISFLCLCWLSCRTPLRYTLVQDVVIIDKKFCLRKVTHLSFAKQKQLKKHLSSFAFPGEQRVHYQSVKIPDELHGCMALSLISVKSKITAFMRL